MTAIPDGGHAEVEWGARFSGMEIPERVCNYEGARESARAHVATGSEVPGREATLVAREVTYGPWLAVDQAPASEVPAVSEAANCPHVAYVDDALRALGGDSADFRAKGIPGSAAAPYAVGLFCGLCAVDGSRIGTGVYSIGEIELWELVADAREHFEKHHAATQPATGGTGD